MYRSRPMSPEVQKLLNVLPPDVAEELRGVYEDYASLLQEAERDRQAVLGFVDNLGARLDELPADPQAARERASAIVARAKDDAVAEALTSPCQ